MTQGLLIMLSAFAAGWWLRRRGWLGPAQAERLLQAVVWIGLPALIFASVSVLPLHARLLLLPLAGAALVLLVGPCAWLVARAQAAGAARRGVLATAPAIMNLALLYPLVGAWGGEAAVARLALIDLGNAALTFTLVYATAARYGHGAGTMARSLGAMVRFPPFWALWLALLANAGEWSVPNALLEILAWLGGALLYLVPLALGVYFRPTAVAAKLTAWGVGVRLGIGALLGVSLVWLLPLDRLSGVVLLAAALAPIGFNALVFASRVQLDRELAAALVTWSVPPALALATLWLWSQPARLS